jgi:hypothetical protein
MRNGISRWEFESVLEGVQRRLDEVPDAMTVRRRTFTLSSTLWELRRQSNSPSGQRHEPHANANGLSHNLGRLWSFNFVRRD